MEAGRKHFAPPARVTADARERGEGTPPTATRYASPVMMAGFLGGPSPEDAVLASVGEEGPDDDVATPPRPPPAFAAGRDPRTQSVVAAALAAAGPPPARAGPAGPSYAPAAAAGPNPTATKVRFVAPRHPPPPQQQQQQKEQQQQQLLQPPPQQQLPAAATMSELMAADTSDGPHDPRYEEPRGYNELRGYEEPRYVNDPRYDPALEPGGGRFAAAPPLDRPSSAPPEQYPPPPRYDDWPGGPGLHFTPSKQNAPGYGGGRAGPGPRPRGAGSGRLQPLVSMDLREEFKAFHSLIKDTGPPWFSFAHFLPRCCAVSLHIPYLYAHALLFCVLAIAGAIAIYEVEIDGSRLRRGALPFVDALFVAVSAAANVGLYTIDVSRLRTGSHITLLVLMQLGSPVLGSLAFARLRRIYLSREMRKRALSEEAKAELHTEFRAFGLLLAIVPLYIICCQLLGFVILGAYLSTNRPDITVGVEPWWWAAFVSVSAFCNAGFSLHYRPDTGQFPTDTCVLLLVASLVLAGNVAAPVFLRGLLVLLARWARPGPTRDAYAHLLTKSHMFYSHLFSRTLTVALALFSGLITAAGTVLFLILEYKHAALAGFTPWERFLTAGFLAISVRMAGFSNVPIGALTGCLQFVYFVMMYVPSLPLFDAEEEDKGGDSGSARARWGRLVQGVRHNGKRLVTAFTSWLAASTLIILAIESEKMLADPLRLTVWAVAFEVVSAFGSSSFSLGYDSPETLVENFSVALEPASKVVIMFLMTLGRHRDLAYFLSLQERLERETVAIVQMGAALAAADGAQGGVSRGQLEALRRATFVPHTPVGPTPNRTLSLTATQEAARRMNSLDMTRINPAEYAARVAEMLADDDAPWRAVERPSHRLHDARQAIVDAAAASFAGGMGQPPPPLPYAGSEEDEFVAMAADAALGGGPAGKMPGPGEAPPPRMGSLGGGPPGPFAAAAGVDPRQAILARARAEAAAAARARDDADARSDRSDVTADDGEGQHPEGDSVTDLADYDTRPASSVGTLSPIDGLLASNTPATAPPGSLRTRVPHAPGAAAAALAAADPRRRLEGDFGSALGSGPPAPAPASLRPEDVSLLFETGRAVGTPRGVGDAAAARRTAGGAEDGPSPGPMLFFSFPVDGRGRRRFKAGGEAEVGIQLGPIIAANDRWLRGSILGEELPSEVASPATAASERSAAGRVAGADTAERRHRSRVLAATEASAVAAAEEEVFFLRQAQGLPPAPTLAPLPTGQPPEASPAGHGARSSAPPDLGQWEYRQGTHPPPLSPRAEPAKPSHPVASPPSGGGGSVVWANGGPVTPASGSSSLMGGPPSSSSSLMAPDFSKTPPGPPREWGSGGRDGLHESGGGGGESGSGSSYDYAASDSYVPALNMSLVGGGTIPEDAAEYESRHSYSMEDDGRTASSSGPADAQQQQQQQQHAPSAAGWMSLAEAAEAGAGPAGARSSAGQSPLDSVGGSAAGSGGGGGSFADSAPASGMGSGVNSALPSGVGSPEQASSSRAASPEKQPSGFEPPPAPAPAAAAAAHAAPAARPPRLLVEEEILTVISSEAAREAFKLGPDPATAREALLANTPLQHRLAEAIDEAKDEGGGHE